MVKDDSFHATLRTLLEALEVQVCEQHQKRIYSLRHQMSAHGVIGLHHEQDSRGRVALCDKEGLQCEAFSGIMLHMPQIDCTSPPQIAKIPDASVGDWPAASVEEDGPDLSGVLSDFRSSIETLPPLERWTKITSALTERQKVIQAQFVFDARPFWRANMKLLKSNMERCGSTRSIQSYTARQSHRESQGAKTDRCMLHPESKYKVICGIVSFCFVLFDIFTIPLSFALLPYPGIAAWICRIWWTLDLLIQFRSGCCDSKGNIQMNASHCGWLYIKTWFPLDFVVLLADWLAHWIREFKHPTALRVVRIFRAARLIRAFKFTGSIIGLGGNIGVIYRSGPFLHQVRLFQYVSTMVVYFHLQACLWYTIGTFEGGWVSRQGGDSYTASSHYIASLKWALTFSSSRIEHFLTSGERVFALVTYVLSTTLLIWFGARVTFLVIELADKDTHAIRAAYHEYRRRHPVSVRSHKILQTLARKHGDRLRLKRIAAEETELLNSFPMRYQAFLRFEARGHLLHCSPFMFYLVSFRPVHACAEKLCIEGMVDELFFTDDRVFHEGILSMGMSIVDLGTLEYIPGAYFRMKQSEQTSAFIERSKRASSTILRQGDCMSEAALWTTWRYRGELMAQSNSSLVNIDSDGFCRILQEYADMCAIAVRHARQCVLQLNKHRAIHSDLHTFAAMSDDQPDLKMNAVHTHLLFLSHFKVEAGTEATLMMQDLTRMIKQDLFNPACDFDLPVFVDSEALDDLNALKDAVVRSQYLVVLLTPGILSRPWCLVEFVTAVRNNVELRPIEIQRPGLKFQYPDESYFACLREGKTFSAQDAQIFLSEGIQHTEIEASIRKLFAKIAKPFSPHKSVNVRMAELEDLLRRCPWRAR